VEFPGAPTPSVPAALAAPLPGDAPELAIGREVALVFEAGDPGRPIIVGWMERASAADPEALRVVQVNGRRVVLEATGELQYSFHEPEYDGAAVGTIVLDHHFRSPGLRWGFADHGLPFEADPWRHADWKA